MAGNQNGDPHSFQSLQEDAIRRAIEMQARAHLSPSGPPDPPRQQPEQPSPPEQAPETDAAPEHASERTSSPEATGSDDLLGSLLKDNERTLIWVLLLILIEEKADTALIFALLYLIS